MINVIQKRKKYLIGVNYSEYNSEELQNISSTFLENGMHGLCFSPYGEGQKPGDLITEAQIRRRLEIIAPYIKWIRSFSCTEENDLIPKLAKEYGLKTLVGAWLGDDKAQNEKEITSLIKLGESGLIDITVVGNETLVREELTEQQLIAYINRIKRALPGIPLGYVDAYYQFVERPKLIEACDILLVNCYPYWEGCSIEDSLYHAQQMFGEATDAAKGKKVIITESGWPSVGGSLKGAFSSKENAMRYFINIQKWSENAAIDLFYFFSFDESWKVGTEGDVGAYWGLWDKNEKLKF